MNNTEIYRGCDRETSFLDFLYIINSNNPLNCSKLVLISLQFPAWSWIWRVYNEAVPDVVPVFMSLEVGNTAITWCIGNENNS